MVQSMNNRLWFSNCRNSRSGPSKFLYIDSLILRSKRQTANELNENNGTTFMIHDSPEKKINYQFIIMTGRDST